MSQKNVHKKMLPVQNGIGEVKNVLKGLRKCVWGVGGGRELLKKGIR